MTDFETIIPQFATRALLYEAVLHPKPGLVDALDSGAHTDMNIYTFLNSTTALAPFFINYFKLGYTHTGTNQELFEKLRQEGILAEKAMFKATNGVNTHKGANFSFAVILGATGMYLQKEENSKKFHFTRSDTQKILEKVQAMTVHLIEDDLKKIKHTKDLTHGEKLYLEKGRTGIRGEASQGYPALTQLLLPFLRKNKDIDTDYLLLQGLLLLMSEIEDANILHRGGEKAWREIKKESALLFSKKLSYLKLTESLIYYNDTLKKRYLSPGGAADLLSLGIYFSFLEKIF